jgi:hypothetical protein
MDIDITLSARSGGTLRPRATPALFPRHRVVGVVFVTLGLLIAPLAVQGWNNGPAGNASTDTVAECTAPPYSTHDWVADHAVALLPALQ